MRLSALLFGSVALLLLLAGVSQAQDAPVVLNPLHAKEGYMFDWIFFAIMLPIPGWLLWDHLSGR